MAAALLAFIAEFTHEGANAAETVFGTRCGELPLNAKPQTLAEGRCHSVVLQVRRLKDDATENLDGALIGDEGQQPFELMPGDKPLRLFVANLNQLTAKVRPA